MDFGNQLLMDDANVPSLLAMAYLGDVDIKDPIYQNTRRFVWSEDNPYFFKGKAGEGIGGPHIGYNMIWPMSIMMKAFTSRNDKRNKRMYRAVAKYRCEYRIYARIVPQGQSFGLYPFLVRMAKLPVRRTNLKTG